MTTTELWTLIPLLILACGSVLVLMLGAIVPGRCGTAIGVAACAGTALWALLAPPQPMAPPTLGVTFTPFARFFLAFFAVTAGLSLLLAHDHAARQGLKGEEYPATVLFGAFGMGVVASAANFLTLFLGLEALTFAFYILVAYDHNRPASGEAGLKYLLMGAVSAAFVAFGIALLYGATGTLEIGRAVAASAAGGGIALAGWGLLLAGLAFKISLAPAHLWTPDIYQGGPTPVVAFLASGSKGAAIALFLLILPPLGGIGPLRAPLWGLAFLSMTVGNLAALLQPNVKRMLAYSSVAQMGYVALALLSGGRGYEAAAFYAVAYGAMGLAAFGALASLEGETPLEQVDDLRGLGYHRPFQGVVLAVAMLALAGIPPTVGFAGKFAIFFAALKGGEAPLAIIGILTAAASAYYYLRVVVNLYMKQADEAGSRQRPTVAEALSLGIAALAIIILGIWPGPLFDLAAAILL
ncbi:NADH-quinone oxidoreductase subunit N [Geobacter hydrogenophilus]|uniref:NADH-quinone oxidoreductase subunit N n=1 Tax=Geobacter hydrogenophilus TaxID=40983 RepID=A0A9W6G0B5_9BACT|nr:NADH-quinone oxidoreductase subunit N [Geobacter hydrogenophilus]MBT0893944.1 NADH-quinone oxidoreductase subunit N [Geobacter hydrogenophilus]GLI38110.1 NADH-quinone oxidoreductase subunit N [Geobacter hydrogenophilus]